MTALPTVPYKRADLALAVAALAQRRLPRGKGAVPRVMGRISGQRPRYLMTRHGARLVMSPRAWDVYATMAIHGGAWDYHDLEWCVNGLAGSGVFYDIGANVGYFSVEIARRLGPAARVVAFEPQADLAAAIAESARLNGMTGVQVVAALVGDRPGQADLFTAAATIHASAVADSGRDPRGTTPVPMVSIDDLVARGEIPPPDMVKADVEGSEHLVLRGAARTFRDCQPHLFLEYIADCDPGQRIRREVEGLAADCPGVALFGHDPRGRAWPWFRLRSPADWAACDSVFLRSAARPVADPAVFEP